MFISSISFFSLIIVNDVIKLWRTFDFFNLADVSSFGEHLFFIVISVFLLTAFCVYAYLITKYIDFESYVKALMYGCNVYHKFDKISYLLTRSWFYQEAEDSEDDETVYFSSSIYSEQTNELLEEDFGDNEEYGKTYGDLYIDRRTSTQTNS